MKEEKCILFIDRKQEGKRPLRRYEWDIHSNMNLRLWRWGVLDCTGEVLIRDGWMGLVKTILHLQNR
jgi:hypothetical protein